MHALVKRVGAGLDPLHRLGTPGIDLVGDGRQLEQRLLECVEAVLVAWCHVAPSVSWRVTCAWPAACASARRPVAVAAPPRRPVVPLSARPGCTPARPASSTARSANADSRLPPHSFRGHLPPPPP